MVSPVDRQRASLDRRHDEVLAVANPYPADFADDTGQVRLGGEITFTDNANQPGGGSVPVTTGAGSPVGAVTPTGIGALYLDTTGGGVYEAQGATSADWFACGGNTAGSAPGLDSGGAPTTAALVDAAGGQFLVSGGDAKIGVATGKEASVQVNANQLKAFRATDDGAGQAKLCFYQFASPVVQPVVPLTSPTAQNVIDALVALGLVAQSD